MGIMGAAAAGFTVPASVPAPITATLAANNAMRLLSVIFSFSFITFCT